MKKTRLAAAAAAVLGLGLATVGASSPASANPGTLLNPVPKQNAGHDGRAYDVAVRGGIAYVGGDFNNAVAYGGGSPTARRNMAAYNVASGAVTGFTANTNGVVYAVISDGVSLYIGGDFTTVNGQSATRVAKLNLSSGAVDTGFNANANGSVRGLAVSGSRLYLAGWFTRVGNQNRPYVASVNKANGALDAAFNANADSRAYAVELGPTGRLYVGGKFTSIGGSNRARLAELNPATGAGVGPASFAGLNGKVLDISLSPDGARVLGAVDDGQNSAFSWSAANGARQWSQKANGNVQDILWVNGNVYFGFHDGFGGDNTLRVLAADGASGRLENGFRPNTNGLKGVLGLATDGTRLVAVGDFNKMGGRNDRGVAIFG